VLDLCELASIYVRLEGEIAETRRLMLIALSNGHDPSGEPRPNPTKARLKKPGGTAYAARMATAAAAETQILDLLKTKAMGPGELAQATNSSSKTTADRLRRLRAKGLVEPDENGWRAVAS
jgi:hypothetical protein